ncbi:unnamed protein product [Allacma fusca]|uniref:HAT C-terminal dimerisation domain-containing protein n=1 Tax=Allacma fusca TaxID=39272 RepID=A0A8J2JZW4_9HEXA|nr:unnamed protein product [Allacma fusca]
MKAEQPEKFDSDLNEKLLDHGVLKTLAQIRNIMTKIKYSHILKDNLHKLCDQMSVRKRLPILDVKHRWNSTFEMINRAEELKGPLNSLCIYEGASNEIPVEQDALEGDDFDSHIQVRRSRSTDSEVSRFFNENPEFYKTDILSWCKAKSKTFAYLSKIARDFLCAKQSSVPAERELSGGVDLACPTRGRLASATIIACMTLKSWWKSAASELIDLC